MRTFVKIVVGVVVGIIGLGVVAVATAPEPAAATAEPAFVPVVVAPVDENAYLRGIAAVDPGLTVNHDRALRRGANICDDIAAGKDEPTIIGNARERLSGGNATITDEQAADAVALARLHLCR
jgi:hypothetical protein